VSNNTRCRHSLTGARPCSAASPVVSSEDVGGVSNVLGPQPIDRQIEVVFQPSFALSQYPNRTRPQSTNGTAERIRRTLVTIRGGGARSHQPRPSLTSILVTMAHDGTQLS
jgi:hypothetical protein